MERYDATTGGPGTPSEVAPDESSESGVFSRVITAILRFFFQRKYGETERGEHANAGPGEGMAKLTFKLRLDPAGPMAPMINAMIKPPMLIAAEDLANKIIGHLEAKNPH